MLVVDPKSVSAIFTATSVVIISKHLTKHSTGRIHSVVRYSYTRHQRAREVERDQRGFNHSVTVRHDTPIENPKVK